VRFAPPKCFIRISKEQFEATLDRSKVATMSAENTSWVLTAPSTNFMTARYFTTNMRKVVLQSKWNFRVVRTSDFAAFQKKELELAGV
jgi:hypothetical protein